MKTILRKVIPLCFLAVMAQSCKKEILLNSVDSSIISKNTLIPYSFDWENRDYMPTPAGNDILVPWASGANRSFPLIFTTDIKKSDGWELVYNTFETGVLRQPLYFILYNRYRGLFRGYFYLTPSSAIPSSNIAHSLVQDAGGSPSPLLSYSASEVADLSINTPVTTNVQEFRTSATGTWFAAEFEMAYDPTVSGKAAANTKMVWQVNSINTTNLILNGTSTGTIKGNITTTSGGGSLLGTLIPGLITFGSEQAIDDKGSDLKDPIKLALKTAVNSGLNGVVKNLLNGLFGGASQSTQYANLTTSAQMTFTGTATDFYQLQNPSLVTPGTMGQDNVDGYTPLYKSPLGIVTLSAPPKSDFVVPVNRGETDDYYWDFATCTLVPGSYQIIFNPSVINSSANGATIQNLKQEIVSTKNYYSHEGHYTTFPVHDEPETPIPSSAKTEQIGGKTAIIDDIPANNRIPFKYFYNVFPIGSAAVTADTFLVGKAMPSTFLRVSFDVVPNNGAPKSTVVKTFAIILRGIQYNING
ncbi:hypothetical protein ACTJKC_02150 [Pedobacter sp. 22226]|uniref:hypothetical protein n=1 Tax=Pedobacter sp. 22226 TaxID=3453894 RepID=UPI003F850DDF